MKNAILNDLLNGASTVDALRLRLRVAGDIVADQLVEAKAEGLVEESVINHLIHVYRLTDKGHQYITDLTALPK
jgi:DNA-binding HxlR family transcriptional regulator